MIPFELKVPNKGHFYFDLMVHAFIVYYYMLIYFSMIFR